MGDGPGYDHLARVREEQERLRAQRRLRRLGHIRAMLHDVGIVEATLPNTTILDETVSHHLTQAYEILSLQTRGDQSSGNDN